jgi:hypothetical protein
MITQPKSEIHPQSLTKADVDVVHNVPDVIAFFDQLRATLDPNDFSPLDPITGRKQVPMPTYLLPVYEVGKKWIELTAPHVGAQKQNVFTALALHYDRSIGIVAFALELAKRAYVDSLQMGFSLSKKEYYDVLDEVFVKDCAGILSMQQAWGVDLPDDVIGVCSHGRSMHRNATGYNILLSVHTLWPCVCVPGVPYYFRGTRYDKKSREHYFSCNEGKTGEYHRLYDLV